MSKLLPFAVAAITFGALLLPTAAFAQSDAPTQYAHAPFIEQTVPESQALGLETIGNKLLLVATTSPAAFDDDFVDQLTHMSTSDLPRFYGTLQSKDPALATSLSKALDAVGDGAGDGEDVTGAVQAAQALLAKAYDAVLEQSLRNDPSFKAGLMVNLLLADGGVSEAYEGAVEDHDQWAYAGGWSALQRVKQLWAELKPLGTPQRQADGQEMIDALDKLFPSAEPPKSMAGANGDDAEVPAQRLSGIMEEVASSDLYPDRDLPALTGHLADVTGKACDAYTAGHDQIAAESVYAAFDHYSSHVSDTAAIMAPELQKKVSALFGNLIGANDDDDDAATGDDDAKASAAKADDDDDDDDAIAVPNSPVEACGELEQAFVDLRTALGG